MSSTLSIIIPVYNSGASAIRLLESLPKTELKLEIVCINDGSTDDSEKILKKYATKHPEVHLISQENGGAAAARNTGLNNIHGDLVCFLDSDDIVLPNFSELADYLSNDDILLSCGALEYYRLDTKTKKIVFSDKLRKQKDGEDFIEYVLNIMAQDGRFNGTIPKIFRRKIIEDNNIRFNEDMLIGEDTCFLFDYFLAMRELNKRPGIAFCNKAVYRYNYANSSSLASENTLLWQNWQKIISYIAQKLNNSNERKLLKKISRRWRIACILSVARSDKKFGEKCKFINPVLLLFAQIIIKFRK